MPDTSNGSGLRFDHVAARPVDLLADEMGQTAPMELWELSVRESVRDLVARYNANGDAGRFEQLMELFAPDAVMELKGTGMEPARHEGLESIRTIFTGTKDRLQSGATDGPRYLRHFTATHQIDVESPTSARGRCYFAVLMAHGLDHWGRYVDRYEERDGRWYFVHRTVTTDGRVADSAL